MKLKKPHRLRVVMLGALFVGLAAVVTGRLYVLQYARHDHYVERADRQHYKRVIVQPERGDIVDRAGQPLAQSTGRFSVYINPKYFRAPYAEVNETEMIETIARESELPLEDVRAAFASQGATRLAKRMAPVDARLLARVLDQYDSDGRGYWLDRESMRIYSKKVAASVIGFCQKDDEGDNVGLAGLEYQYDKQLHGAKIVGRSQRSAISQTMKPWEPEELLAARGNTLVLTLDTNIQEAAERALANAIEKWNADCAGVVVMEVNTGAVVAMASYPTFDSNKFAEAKDDARRNRTLTDPLETGSVVKLFTASMLIDKGYITPDTVIDCENGYAVVDGRRLHDSPGHYLGVTNFRHALRFSSNIGIVKAAQVLENNEWYAALRGFGFGAPTGIDLPGEGSGLLYPVEKWTKFSRTSLPMGYEIALTPVQIVAGISSLVNGGIYYEPYVVAEIRDAQGNVVERHEPKPLRSTIRPTTSAVMRDLMEDVVDLGTGTKAQVGGYRVGGKTGTTRKSNVFSHPEYIASFAGAFPMNDPRVAVYVYIDNPKGEYYASAVAAPAFQEIAQACVVQLGIPPSEEVLTEEKPVKPGRKPKEPPPDPLVVEAEFEAQQKAGNAELSLYGRMPDFRLMTMKEAREALPPGLASVKFLGSGIVTDQLPAPGEPLTGTSEAVLHFSPDTQAATALLAPAPDGGSR